jgi:uncharacterized membrane protein
MRLIRLLKNDIAREAAEWVSEDIITAPQAERICDRYGVDYHRVSSRSFAYNVLIGLGYLFIGLALITLLGANWDEMPRALRMWGLIIITMATQGVALKFYLAGAEDRAAGVFFLGNLVFGASIILIAQVYHLGEHMPDGVFWWALGCLPMGVLISSSWVTLQALVLALVWFMLEVDMGFYPLLFPLFILGSLVVLYRGQQSTILFLALVASIVLWVEYSLALYWGFSWRLRFQAEHVAVSAALLILAYAGGHWLGRRESAAARDYGAILAAWSLRLAIVALLVASFEEPWRELLRESWEHMPSMLVLVCLLLAASLYLARSAQKTVPVAVMTGFLLLSIAAVLVSGSSSHAVYFQVVCNLLLIAAGVWLIIRGIHDGISHYFFLGVASILLTAFMRYIDLIGDYIGGAAIFLVFAAVLLGAAKYWKGHLSREGAV